MKKSYYWMTEDEYLLVTKISPLPCVDLVVLREIDSSIEILLIKRRIGYEKGKWCIIGGRERLNETLLETINRQAIELGIKVRVISPFSPNFPALVNDNPQQDKTKHSVTNTYPVKIISGNIAEKGNEFENPKWFAIANLPLKIAYDHRFQIIETINQLRKFGQINKR